MNSQVMIQAFFVLGTFMQHLILYSALMFLMFAVDFRQVNAQSQPSSTPTPPLATGPGTSTSDGDDKHPLGTMEEEMKAKREIRLREKEYQENLGRARQVADLGAQLKENYQQHHTLTRDDAKKLERIEKLTKRIRSDAGGSDEDDAESDLPQQLEPAITRLADESDQLKSSVEKTPKHVISAVVIEKANVLLKLIKIARNLIP